MTSLEPYLSRILSDLAQDPAFAGFAAARTPLLIWDNAAQRLLWASPAAEGLARAAAGPDGRVDPARPAAARLRLLGQGLAPTRGLRLERLRLDPLAPPLALACRRVPLEDGGEVLVTAVAGSSTKTAARPALPGAGEPSASRRSAPRPADGSPADPRGRGIVRFLWRADAQTRFTSVSPALAETVGPMAGDIVGLTWDEVSRSVADDPAGEVAGLFARGVTWSGRTLHWSVDNGPWRIPVDWAGMPVFGETRALVGFRGFGLLRTDEAFVGGEAEARPGSDARPPERAEPPPDRGTAPEPAARPRRDPNGESWFTDIRERVAAQLGRRALPIRDDARLDDGAPASGPVGAPRPAEPLSRLSTAERSAFREIAKALGARLEPDATEPDATEPDGVEGAGSPSDLAPSPNPGLDPGEDGRSLGEPETSGEGSKAVPPVEPVRALPSAAGPQAVLERLPLGALVHREERVLFANRVLLELAGYAPVEDLAAEGGIGRFLGGSLPLGGSGGLTLLTLATRRGNLPVEAQVATIDWEGAPAGLVLVRQTPVADLSARLEAAERALGLREARVRELEERERDQEERAARFAALEADEGERDARMQDLEARANEREARARELEGILDTATDGVVVTDETGRILSLNRSAEALFGYDAEAVVGDAVTVLLAPESHIVALDYLDRLRSSGMARLLNDGREVTGRVRQGGTIPLFMAMGPVQDGPNPKVCAVLRDITAFKQAEAELVAAKRAAEAANAQKSDVLAKISHEIRTPLNAILGFAEVMLEERFGPIANERYREYLRDVHASGSHVISLVNDLLDLAKIEAGRMELTFTGVSLNELVQACVSLLQPQAARERIVVRTSFAQRLPAVVADERSLRQIALNLVSNAVKFTDAGGQVIVSTALTDQGEVAFRVRDTGPGMSEAEIAAALEPFRQLATTHRSGGTGLGLPLTKALVEANRGAMRITSAPGEGTLVEVLFPPARVGVD